MLRNLSTFANRASGSVATRACSSGFISCEGGEGGEAEGGEGGEAEGGEGGEAEGGEGGVALESRHILSPLYCMERFIRALVGQWLFVRYVTPSVGYSLWVYRFSERSTRVSR